MMGCLMVAETIGSMGSGEVISIREGKNDELRKLN